MSPVRSASVRSYGPQASVTGRRGIDVVYRPPGRCRGTAPALTRRGLERIDEDILQHRRVEDHLLGTKPRLPAGERHYVSVLAHGQEAGRIGDLHRLVDDEVRAGGHVA